MSGRWRRGILLAMAWGSVGAVTAGGVTACSGHRSTDARTMHVSRVYVVTPVGDAPAVMYLTIENNTGVADTLIELSVNGAGRTELHRSMTSAMPASAEHSHGAMSMPMPMPMPMQHAMMTMIPVPRLAIGPGETVRLAPGSYHAMVFHPPAMRRGDSVAVTLRFARAGVIRAMGHVITYADVDSTVRSQR